MFYCQKALMGLIGGWSFSDGSKDEKTFIKGGALSLSFLTYCPEMSGREHSHSLYIYPLLRPHPQNGTDCISQFKTKKRKPNFYVPLHSWECDCPHLKQILAKSKVIDRPLTERRF